MKRENVYPNEMLDRVWPCSPTVELADAENYYTKGQVDRLISGITVSGVTEEELNEAIASAKTEIEAEIPVVPTSNTAFTNDAGYITSGEAQTQIDSSISGKADTSSLATVATSGSYNDLSNKPTIPSYTAGSGITISNNVISAKIWSGTQAQFDVLTTKDNDCIYLIYNS